MDSLIHGLPSGRVCHTSYAVQQPSCVVFRRNALLTSRAAYKIQHIVCISNKTGELAVFSGKKLSQKPFRQIYKILHLIRCAICEEKYCVCQYSAQNSF